MMQRVSKPDQKFRQIVTTAFPDYRGRKFYFDVVPPDQIMSLDSYWDSGYRSYYQFVSLTDGRTLALPQNGTMFDGPLSGGIKSTIPDGFALVCHQYAGCGQYIKITVNSNNAALLIASPGTGEIS